MDALGADSYAAKLCADLDAYGSQDWYLPAAGELNAMYQQLGPGGSNIMPSGYYWSSSEYNLNSAWGQNFANGIQGNYFNIYLFGARCRCVRI